MLLFFTQPGCVFCERARRDYLRPMATSQEWNRRALILEVARDRPVSSFDGSATTGAELASKLGVRAYPTVIMVDHTGQILAEPLVGYTVPDFYGAYLEQRIATATDRQTRL